MDPDVTRPSARTHRVGLQLAAAMVLAGLMCATFAGASAAARSSTGAALRQGFRLAHHLSPTQQAAELRIPTGKRHVAGSPRVTALPASGASLCVGNGPGCFATIQAAIDAAHDGDSIHVGPGTFAGGITIGTSLRLVGAGAASTVIRGGGSVVTIGVFGAPVEPTVRISGVTITGGIARSSPISVHATGQEGVFAAGAGVEIPSNADFSGGADVTISDSVIRGNRVAPSRTVPSGGAGCPGGPCPFALAAGGGIDNWGQLTLANTTISDNRVGTASGLSGLASDVQGGGIMSWQGTLTLTGSSVSGNRAGASAPNGRFADAGAIFAENGSLTMRRSAVIDNHVSLAASLPDSVDMLAIAGGIHVGGGASATILASIISGNSASMTNAVGYATAFSGGLHGDSELELRDDIIAGNSVTAETLPGSLSEASGDSGGGEIFGAFSRLLFAGNTVTIRSAAGNAIAAGGASIFAGDLTDSAVIGNHVSAASPHGAAYVAGGGLMIDFHLVLHDVLVSGNTAQARGVSGAAQGGGIFDAVTPGPQGGPMSLTRSSVTRNAVSGSPGIMLQGGGIFTDNVVTLVNSVIAKNSPDQCVGC
jgi:hypothetical protein